MNDQNDKQKVIKKEQLKRHKGVGIDIGTGNLVTAVSKDNEAFFKLERDAFFEIEKNIAAISMLNKLNASFIESEDKKNLCIIGDEALQMANFFNKDCRRPLAKGVISTKEQSALIMIKIILKQMLGDPLVENEHCYFSVPAKPIDQEDYNVVYHENVLKSFITSFGYNAIPLNEALAIVWSNLADDDYIGMAISFGAGMTNCCLSFMGVSEKDHQFSIARGGDWIDENAAAAVGIKASRITILKESGLDMLNPKTREETAIKIYYENLIDYVCDHIEKKFMVTSNIPNFDKPITIVISGGTSKILNFDKVFEQKLKTKTLPFKIEKIKHAKDSLNAVAEGCLLNALNHYQE